MFFFLNFSDECFYKPICVTINIFPLGGESIGYTKRQLCQIDLFVAIIKKT